jgi:hypothetical protein
MLVQYVWTRKNMRRGEVKGREGEDLQLRYMLVIWSVEKG